MRRYVATDVLHWEVEPRRLRSAQTVVGANSQREWGVFTNHSPWYCHLLGTGHIFEQYLAPTLSDNHKQTNTNVFFILCCYVYVGFYEVIGRVGAHLVRDKLYEVLICVFFPFFQEQAINGELLDVLQVTLAGLTGGT